MKSFFQQLSQAQKIWLTVAAALIVTASLIAAITQQQKKDALGRNFNLQMSIRDAAPQMGLSGKALAGELGLPADVPKGKPLAKLGVTQADLDEAVAHTRSHVPNPWKFALFAALIAAGAIYLMRVGRPDNSDVRNRKQWYPRFVPVTAALVAVLVAGFLLGKSPNPMEGVVKVFKAFAGLYPSAAGKIIVLSAFIGSVLLLGKLICGWACPFGALQELFFSIPGMRRFRRVRLPFWLTNTIRTLLFAVMILILFGWVGGRGGLVIYHYLNPFNVFNLSFSHWLIATVTVAVLAAAFFVYRPFCYLICPFGLVSWMAEKVSLVGIRIDRDVCIDCAACSKACPGTAAEGKLKQHALGADCFSCGRCLNVCPVDAISYGNRLSSKSASVPENADSEPPACCCGAAGQPCDK